MASRRLFDGAQAELGLLPVVAAPALGPQLYAVVAPDAGWTNPTATQIIQGKDGNGNAATWAGSAAAPTSSTTFDWPSLATGLSLGVSYRVAVVWYDGTNTSNVAVSSPFTTTDSVAGASTLDSGYAVQSAAGLTLNSSFSVRSAGLASLDSGYPVQSTAGAALNAGYPVRSAGLVTLNTSYEVIGTISSGSATLNAGFPVVGAGNLTLNAGFPVQSAASATLNSGYPVRSAGLVTLNAGYEVISTISSGSATLNAGFPVVGSGVSTVSAGFAVATSSQVSLDVGFAVSLPASTGSATLAVGYAARTGQGASLGVGYSVTSRPFTSLAVGYEVEGSGVPTNNLVMTLTPVLAINTRIEQGETTLTMVVRPLITVS